MTYLESKSACHLDGISRGIFLTNGTALFLSKEMDRIEPKSAYHLNEVFGENVWIDGTARSVLRKRKRECAVSFVRKTGCTLDKQMKRSIFSGTCNCGQMVQKFPGILVKARKRDTSKGITFFRKTFHRDEPFHLNSPGITRKFHSNGKRSKFRDIRAGSWGHLAFLLGNVAAGSLASSYSQIVLKFRLNRAVISRKIVLFFRK